MSDASSFIASHKRLSNTVVTVSIAISFAVIIVALAVCSGFRRDIRQGLSELGGDIRISPVGNAGNGFGSGIPFDLSQVPLDEILAVDGVKSVSPVIYIPGVIRNEDGFNGMLFKGIDSASHFAVPSPMSVFLPRTFANKSGIGAGSQIVCYFVRDSKTVVRKFTVESIYDNIIGDDSKSFIICNIDDIRKLARWEKGQVGSLEIMVDDRFKQDETLKQKTDEIGIMLLADHNPDKNNVSLWASNNETLYYDIFDWLSLIDSNVSFILVIMVLVAGFNMISGLLIMLFENISTIGTLKALGMKDSQIGRTFRKISSRCILFSMLWGNLAAVALCLIQKYTGLLKLNAENYFLSRVPIELNPVSILTVDVICYLVIMLLLMLPVIFIRRISPSESIRNK